MSGSNAASLATGVLEATQRGELLHFECSIRPLMLFTDATEQTSSKTLPSHQNEYFKLVDITGRATTGDQRGCIDPALAPILERLNLSADQWIAASSAFRRYYRAGDLRKTG